MGGMVVVAWLIYEFSPPREGTLSNLKDEGNVIVSKLEEYKLQHGEYPADLRSAQIDAPKHYHGNWTYWIADDRSRFGLWIHHNGSLHYDEKSGWTFAIDTSS